MYFGFHLINYFDHITYFNRKETLKFVVKNYMRPNILAVNKKVCCLFNSISVNKQLFRRIQNI